MISISFILLLFFSTYDLDRVNICVIIVESGKESISNIPSVSSALSVAKEDCSGSMAIVDSGSIFEKKEVKAFYFFQKEGESPPFRFLEEMGVDHTAIPPLVFEMYPERVREEIGRSKVKALTVNSSFSRMRETVNLGGIKIFFASFISEKGFKYLSDEVLKKWELVPPFERFPDDPAIRDMIDSSHIKVAVFNDYFPVQYDDDDFSDMMVYFHNSFSPIDVFVTDGVNFDESKSLRQSLVSSGTSGEPVIKVLNYSLIKGESGSSVATILDSVKTFDPAQFPPDSKMEEIVAVYNDKYNAIMEDGITVNFPLKCNAPGKEECILDRIYSAALKESVSDCGRDVDFTISYSVNKVVDLSSGEILANNLIHSLFSLYERSVYLKLSWHQITEIMNDESLHKGNRLLSLSPLNYSYSRGLEFLPSRQFRTDREFKVAMPVSLFRVIDEMYEFEDDFCVSGTFPSNVLMNTPGFFNIRHFRPLWRVTND